MRTGDYFLGHPLKDFYDCSVCSAHHNRGPFCHQTLRTEQWQMVTNGRLLHRRRSNGSNREPRDEVSKDDGLQEDLDQRDASKSQGIFREEDPVLNQAA